LSLLSHLFINYSYPEILMILMLVSSPKVEYKRKKERERERADILFRTPENRPRPSHVSRTSEKFGFTSFRR